MILVFYGFLVIGLGLLILDVTGRLVVAPERARWWRWVGLAAAAGPGLGPLIAWITGQLIVSWPFPLIAFGYVSLFLAFATGALDLAGTRTSVGLRRVAYAGLLLLAALPSFVLLMLTPLVALPGLGLTRSGAGRAYGFRAPGRAAPNKKSLTDA